MQVKLGMIAGLMLVLALNASAGIVFEYRQRTQSDVETLGSSDITAKVTMEGDSSRIEFQKGSIYPPGTYLISTQGSRTMMIVNPLNKSYAEVDYSAIALNLGNANIQIANPKSELKTLGDHPSIAGFPTDHYQLVMSYDMTVVFGEISLKQTVKTVIDKWMTSAFGEVAASLLEEGALHTGNAELDTLIDAETTKIKGFPLRQIVEISTTMQSRAYAGSKLKFNPSRRQRTEMVVSRISKTDVPTAHFEVPRSYQKLERGQEAKKEKDGPVHILNMEAVADTDGN